LKRIGLKKKLLTTIALLSFALIFSSNCFTSAEIQNTTNVKITNWKNALISIPDKILIVDGKAKITIKNNISERIWVHSNDVNLTLNKGNINEENLSWSNEIGIDPGQKVKVCISVADDAPVINKVIFKARWLGGSAEITSLLQQQLG
jgi:hypothetical protein